MEDAPMAVGRMTKSLRTLNVGLKFFLCLSLCGSFTAVFALALVSFVFLKTPLTDLFQREFLEQHSKMLIAVITVGGLLSLILPLFFMQTFRLRTLALSCLLLGAAFWLGYPLTTKAMMTETCVRLSHENACSQENQYLIKCQKVDPTNSDAVVMVKVYGCHQTLEDVSFKYDLKEGNTTINASFNVHQLNCLDLSPTICLTMGQAEQANGHPELALGLYRKACRQEVPGSCVLAAKILTRLGRHEEAEKSFDSACQMKDYEACGEMVYYYFQRQQFDLGLKLAREACDQGAVMGCMFVGVHQVDVLKDETLGISTFSKLCTEKQQVGCENLMILLKRSGPPSESTLTVFENLCGFNFLTACGYLGDIKAKDGQFDKAKEYFKKGCDGKDSASCYSYVLTQTRQNGKKYSPEDADRLIENLELPCQTKNSEACVLQAELLYFSNRTGRARDIAKPFCGTPTSRREPGDKNQVAAKHSACALLAQYYFDGKLYLSAYENSAGPCTDNYEYCTLNGKILLNLNRQADAKLSFQKACANKVSEACLLLKTLH
jgi:TPR repeat protein